MKATITIISSFPAKMKASLMAPSLFMLVNWTWMWELGRHLACTELELLKDVNKFITWAWRAGSQVCSSHIFDGVISGVILNVTKPLFVNNKFSLEGSAFSCLININLQSQATVLGKKHIPGKSHRLLVALFVAD